MSSVTRFDSAGVLLHYAGHDAPRRYQTEQRPQVTDRQRTALLNAERELLTLRIIADNLALSDIARTRIADALEAIRIGLEAKRRDYGMAVQAEAAA